MLKIVGPHSEPFPGEVVGEVYPNVVDTGASAEEAVLLCNSLREITDSHIDSIITSPTLTTQLTRDTRRMCHSLDSPHFAYRLGMNL